jgi:hypothetical protein
VFFYSSIGLNFQNPEDPGAPSNVILPPNTNFRCPLCRQSANTLIPLFDFHDYSILPSNEHGLSSIERLHRSMMNPARPKLVRLPSLECRRRSTRDFLETRCGQHVSTDVPDQFGRQVCLNGATLAECSHAAAKSCIDEATCSRVRLRNPTVRSLMIDDGSTLVSRRKNLALKLFTSNSSTKVPIESIRRTFANHSTVRQRVLRFSSHQSCL